MPRAILLTGYNPYPGAPEYNPSGALARELNGRHVDGYPIRGSEIPVAVTDAGPVLDRLLDRVKPIAALAMGVAPGRSALNVERVAVNVLDFRVPDNRGRRYQDKPIRKGGPAAYFSTLPVRPILASLKKAGIPAVLSDTAGTYLCNFAMYALLDGFATRGWTGPAGFIHVPQVPEVTVKTPNQASMDYATIRRGILLALEAMVAATRRRPSRRSA